MPSHLDLFLVPVFDARPYFDPAFKPQRNARDFSFHSMPDTCPLYEQELPKDAFVAVIYSANTWKKTSQANGTQQDPTDQLSLNLYAAVLFSLPHT